MADPRKAPEEPRFVSVPTCNIDFETQVPEDLFNSLVRRGKERRKDGQHILVSRSEKSGGGVKLVQAERVDRVAKLHGRSNANLVRVGGKAGA